MTFENFTSLDFPPRPNELIGLPAGSVYVVFWIADGGARSFLRRADKPLAGKNRRLRPGQLQSVYRLLRGFRCRTFQEQRLPDRAEV